MAGSDRSRRMRALARDLEGQYGTRFEAVYDSGPNWRLDWADGPSYATIRKVVDAAELSGATLRLYRGHSMKAIALTAIRMAAAGKLGRHDGAGARSGPLWMVESELTGTDFPERPADDLQAKLAELLLTHATVDGYLDDRLIASLIRNRGLGWLVEEAAHAGVELPPLTLLSARYAAPADAVQAVAWRERAEPLPVRTAVAAAIADDQLTEAAAIALVALLPELRAEVERTEAAAAAAARRAGVAPELVDAAPDRHHGPQRRVNHGGGQ
ncbi:hypothetical protein [Micromonospora sp. NPDC049662]|uniref:hypothetical protein n=1 Tax=Micromonospora sp. NPDC049662 TaxID=3155397 RepID=UPI00343A282D